MHKPSQDLTDISVKRGPEKFFFRFLPCWVEWKTKHKTQSIFLPCHTFWGILRHVHFWSAQISLKTNFSQRRNSLCTQQVRLCRKLRKLKLWRPKKHQYKPKIMPATLHLPRCAQQKETLELSKLRRGKLFTTNHTILIENGIASWTRDIQFPTSDVWGHSPNKTFHRSVGNEKD